MSKFYKNFPNYDDDSDYNTNANSYYKDLGRKTKLIKLLAKRIWEYDNTLNETLEQIEKRLTDYITENDSLMNERLENWDKRIDEMPEEMRTLFIEWLNDGTLEQIINHDVLGNKADKSFVDTEIERMDKKDENHSTQLAPTENMETVPNTLWEELEEREVNVKWYGAVGDGVADDTEAIQNALDYLYEKGGGVLFFPLGEFKTTKPLIMNSAGNTAGYTYPLITLKGVGTRDSVIAKEGTEKLFDKDATILLKKGISDNLEDSFTGFKFENIHIDNKSTGNETYGVFGKSGSRILTNYAWFTTVRDENNLDSHDRYGFRVNSMWSCSFEDTTFGGDYGYYNSGNSTSIILKNTFARATKISYRIASIYTTIINAFGDYASGILFDFSYAHVSVTSIGGESQNCETMIRVSNSTVDIGVAFFNQSIHDLGTVIDIGGSSVTIEKLNVNMEEENKGYLWKSRIYGKLNIEQLRLTGKGGKFKYLDTEDYASNRKSVFVGNLDWDRENVMPGVVATSAVNGYWDWYMENPQHPINNIYLGMKEPTTNNAGEELGWYRGPGQSSIFFNGDFKNREVLGWVRADESTPSLRNGENWYIPLIRSGSSEERPENPVIGMEFFDSSINQPIWWGGSNWVNSNGETV